MPESESETFVFDVCFPAVQKLPPLFELTLREIIQVQQLRRFIGLGSLSKHLALAELRVRLKKCSVGRLAEEDFYAGD